MIFAIDFDGTCVTHEFPMVGQDIGAAPILRAMAKNGHQLILWTMRSNLNLPPTTENPDIVSQAGNFLDQAVEWFAKNDIPLWGINENPEQKSWTTSPKVFAHKYIDDAAWGAPLSINCLSGQGYVRGYVDWNLIKSYFLSTGIISEEDIH